MLFYLLYGVKSTNTDRDRKKTGAGESSCPGYRSGSFALVLGGERSAAIRAEARGMRGIGIGPAAVIADIGDGVLRLCRAAGLAGITAIKGAAFAAVPSVKDKILGLDAF